jgi:hypothetical protein
LVTSGKCGDLFLEFLELTPSLLSSLPPTSSSLTSTFPPSKTLTSGAEEVGKRVALSEHGSKGVEARESHGCWLIGLDCLVLSLETRVLLWWAWGVEREEKRRNETPAGGVGVK